MVNAMKINEVLSNPYWMPSSLSFEEIFFEEISEHTLKQSSFLDQRAVGKTGKSIKVPIRHLLDNSDLINVTGSINHIFHISHVGSTFIAKLYDEFFAATVYREPTAFKGLAFLCRETKNGVTPFNPTELSLLYELLCKLMMRGNKVTIIKHSSQNLIIPDFSAAMGVSPKPVLFVYTPLKKFLCHGLASPGLQSDAINGSDARIKFFNSVSTLDTVALSQMSKIQQISLIWVAEMIKVLARFDEEREDQLLNFDEVMSTGTKSEMVNTLSDAFDIPILKNQISRIEASPIWEKNSKGLSGGGFASRQQKINHIEMNEKDQIIAGVNWVTKLCDRNIMFRPLLQYIA
jgi:hypothetical protein